MMTLLIGYRVKMRLVLAPRIRFDNRNGPSFRNDRPQRIAVVCRIAQHLLGRSQPRGEQVRRFRRITRLPGRYVPTQHVAGPVTHQMNLARIAAPAAAYALFAVFFSAPVPC